MKCNGKGRICPLPVNGVRVIGSRRRFNVRLTSVFTDTLIFTLAPHASGFIGCRGGVERLPVFRGVGLGVTPSSVSFVRREVRSATSVSPLSFLYVCNGDGGAGRSWGYVSVLLARVM